MKRLFSILLAAALALTVFTPLAGYAMTENLMRWAGVSTDIPCQAESGVANIHDGKTDVGMVSEGSEKPTFPYYIEIDFGGYVAALSDLRIHTLAGKEMGVTNLGVDYWENGRWQPGRSGEMLQWDRSDSSIAEVRDIHFSKAITAEKFRLVIQSANLKEQAFRIDEIEFLGNLTGIRDKKEVVDTEIGYIRCAAGTEVTLPEKVKARLSDGTDVMLGTQWQTVSSDSAGIQTILGKIPYYEIQPRMILDIYDPNPDTSAASGSWAESVVAEAAEQGLLGDLAADPEHLLQQTEAALILFRAVGMTPSLPAADSRLPADMPGREMAASVEACCGSLVPNERLTRAAAAGWIIKAKFGEGESATPLPFSDLNGLDPAALADIRVAFDYGIISSADVFRPFDAVSLGEFLTMLRKAEQGGQTDPDGMISRTFTDTGEVLVNPYMGIFSYYLDNGLVSYDIHYENSEYFEDVPGLSNIYIRIPWSVIEPEKGIYDFSVIDGAIEKFRRVGKQISLRFTASETGHVYATSKWVFDEGAKIHWWGYDGNTHSYSMPYFDDPIFLENLDVFLGEVARRYDGNPNIAYIDVGSLGIWGEGHTGSAGYTLTPEAARKHLELYAKHFKKTKVVVLDDMGQNFNDRFFPEVKDDVIRLGFGLRNDGYAGVDGKMRFILPEDETLGDGIWEQAPIVMEPEHYSEMNKLDIGGNGVDFAHWIDKVHATYIGLHGYSKVMAEENPDFMDYVNKRIGYRILPESVRLSGESHVHGDLELSISWKNVAAAPCYNGAYPALTLKDQEGNIVSVMVDDAFNVKDLPVDDPGKAKPVLEEAVFRLHDVLPGGTYQAYLSLGNITGTPEIKMPIEGNDGEARYYIGDVKIQGDYELTVTQQADDAITLHFDLSPQVGEYTALWGNIAFREQGMPQVYMPGDILISVDTAPLAEALKTKTSCDISVKLTLPDQYKGKEIKDKSLLAGKVFDVFFDMDTLGADMTPGMMLSGQGRSPKIGTAVITEDLTIRFQPNE